MIYSIIRSKGVFYQLANLPEDSYQLVRPRVQPKQLSQQRSEEGGVSSESGTTAKEEHTPQEEPPRGEPNLHVADIKPPGQIKTVEVEVEPHQEDKEDKEETDGGATVPPPETETTEKEGKEERPGESAGDDEAKEEQGEQQATPTATPPTPPPTTDAATTDESGDTQAQASQTTPTVPPPLDMQPPQGRERPETFFGLDHPSPITRLPPLMSPTDDMSGQRSPAGGKKKSKPKALNKDLMACHQDVARSNRELVEPTTPEFKPTTEWVRSWKQKLPLNTVLRLLQVLVPQVEKLCNENDVKSEHEVLDYLKNGTLVGLLPVPHPILIRKYQTSENTEQWFHTYIWGVNYVRNYDPPIWYDTTIKLFQVHKVTASGSLQEQPS